MVTGPPGKSARPRLDNAAAGKIDGDKQLYLALADVLRKISAISFGRTGGRGDER
jgi:hypothetical protein